LTGTVEAIVVGTAEGLTKGVSARAWFGSAKTIAAIASRRMKDRMIASGTGRVV
jgi:hypothetical protein